MRPDWKRSRIEADAMIATRSPDLSEFEIEQLRRLADHGRAVVPLAELPAVLALGEAEAAEVLAALLEHDLVELWPEAAVGPAVVLGAAAAKLLEVELLAPDQARPETPNGTRCLRWVERRRAGPERARVTRTCLMEDLVRETARGDVGDAMDLIADPRAVDPFTIRIVGGWQSQWRLWGLGLVGWCPAVESEVPCRVCHGLAFTHRDICLACRRTGFDDELPPVRAAERPRPVAGADGLAGGVGKAAPRETKPAETKPAGKRPPSGWRMQSRTGRDRSRTTV